MAHKKCHWGRFAKVIRMFRTPEIAKPFSQASHADKRSTKYRIRSIDVVFGAVCFPPSRPWYLQLQSGLHSHPKCHVIGGSRPLTLVQVQILWWWPSEPSLKMSVAAKRYSGPSSL